MNNTNSFSERMSPATDIRIILVADALSERTVTQHRSNYTHRLWPLTLPEPRQSVLHVS